MGKGKWMVILAGLGLAALMVADAGAGWAGIPSGRGFGNGTCIMTPSGNPAPVILARGGAGRGGRGSDGGK